MNSLFTEENSLIEKLHNQVMRHTILEEERADQLKRMAALKKEMESTDRKFRQNELSRKSFLNRLTVLVRQRESANETEKKEKEKEEIGVNFIFEYLQIKLIIKF